MWVLLLTQTSNKGAPVRQIDKRFFEGDSGGVKSSVRLAVIALAGVVLIAGMFFGLQPIKASLTQITPDVRVLTVPCGVGYLPGVPDSSDPVLLKDHPGVALPQQVYADHCSEVSGWHPWVAWILTALGLGGIALIFAQHAPVGSVLSGSIPPKDVRKSAKHPDDKHPKG